MSAVDPKNINFDLVKDVFVFNQRSKVFIPVFFVLMEVVGVFKFVFASPLFLLALGLSFFQALSTLYYCKRTGETPLWMIKANLFANLIFVTIASVGLVGTCPAELIAWSGMIIGFGLYQFGSKYAFMIGAFAAVNMGVSYFLAQDLAPVVDASKFSILANTFYFYYFLAYNRLFRIHGQKLFTTLDCNLEIARKNLSFYYNNPNPVFMYKDSFQPMNDVAKEVLENIGQNELTSLEFHCKRSLEKGGRSTTRLDALDKTYLLEFVKVEDKVYIYSGDITKYVKVMGQARTSQQYAMAIIDAIPGFVSWVDRDFKYLGVNKQLCNLFGKSADYFIGNTLGNTATHEGMDIHGMVDDLFKSNKNILQRELSFEYDGKKSHTLVHIKKYNQNQNAVIVGVDITELKKAQQALLEEQAKAQASAKMASFGEMAAGIAHEINNPLTIISGSNSILAKYVETDRLTPETFKKHNERITSAIERVMKIIRGIKNLARNGENDPFESATIASIVEDSLTLLSKKCMKLNIDLKVSELDPELTIECQTVQISQILVILLNNAIDAIEENEEKWISIDIKDAGEGINISITDSGLGIPVELQKKVFDPFFTTKGVGKGTGLGLSLARKIIELHRGQFSLDSSSKHTKFDIYLPKHYDVEELKSA